MKRRSTDEHDQISTEEIKDARINLWKATKLFLTNLPMIYKIILLVLGIGGGTIAAPQVYQTISEIASGDATIPKGQTLTPDPTAPAVVWQGQVDISLTSQKNAIDTNTAALEAVRAEIAELESRLSAKRDRGDTRLEARVIEIESIVQP